MSRVMRAVAVIVALLLAAIVTGVVALQVVWPRYRPALQPGERWGLDVSEHQGRIDWAAVAGDGVDAAYIKASEGATFQDDRFEENWRGASAAGLDVGAYHFFTLCKGGEEQAANLLDRLDAVGADASDLPPVVDLELGGNCSQRPPVAEIQDRLRSFVARVEERTGQRVVLYLLGDFEELYPVPPDLEDRDRWVRRLALRPGGDWVWWQVSNRARVEGVTGGVDLDVIRPR